MTSSEHRALVLARYPGARCKYTSVGWVVLTKTNICLCNGRYTRSMAWSVAWENAKLRKEDQS